MPTAPRNTATPEGMFEVASQGIQGSPEASKAILKQEADGQRSFTTSSTLPTQMGQDDRTVLEQAGVVFGDKVDGDEMFTYVTLPAGWEMVASPQNDSRWTELHDDKGRRRAMMFYKAAFYDRKAHLSTERRFGISSDYAYQDSNSAFRYNVTDGDTVVFTTDATPFAEKYSDEYLEADKTARSAALAWFEEHYPSWQDASAYWD